MGSLDKINKYFQGKEVVKLASQGNKKCWAIRRQKISARIKLLVIIFFNKVKGTMCFPKKE